MAIRGPLSMNHLLNLWISAHHPGVEVRMIAHQHIWIPCCGYKDRVDTAANGCQEDLAYLKADQKGKRHDDRGESSAGVVGRVGELQVQEGEQGAEVCYKRGTHS